MQVRIIEWLSEGWGLIKDDLMTFALAALICALLGTVTIGVCAPALMFGLYLMVFRRMRGERVQAGDVM